MGQYVSVSSEVTSKRRGEPASSSNLVQSAANEPSSSSSSPGGNGSWSEASRTLLNDPKYSSVFYVSGTAIVVSTLAFATAAFFKRKDSQDAVRIASMISTPFLFDQRHARARAHPTNAGPPARKNLLKSPRK